MNFVITEEQLRVIAEGVNNPKVMESVRKLLSFSTKTINRVSKKYNLNVRLLLTWGPSMGGIVMPLDNFIRSGNFNLSDSQISLILCGVAGVLFYDNQENINKLKEKIQSEGLLNVFKQVLDKGKDLRNAFVNFVKSLNVSLNSVSDILAYAFLIPIIPDLSEFFAGAQNLERTISLISQRLVASGIVLVVADVITEMFKRIAKKD